jgi:hypothetical protein
MFRGYGDALWEMSTPNMILNSPKLIQAMWEDPVGTAGKVAGGMVHAFTDFSSSDMRATGRTTMNWIMALAPIGGKFATSGAKTGSGLKVAAAADDVMEWLGPGAKLKKGGPNENLVIMSADGKKRLQIHSVDPSPHQNPHAHVDEFIGGRWKKSGQIYPKDVDQH